MLLRVRLRQLGASQRRRGNGGNELVGGADRRRGQLARRAGDDGAAQRIADDQIQQVAAVVGFLHRLKVALNFVGQGGRVGSRRRHRSPLQNNNNQFHFFFCLPKLITLENQFILDYSMKNFLEKKFRPA